MRETRNAMTHRPPVKAINMITDDGTAHLLFRHPKWSEVQAFAFAKHPKDEPMAGVLLTQSIVEILDGLCGSMNSYVSAIMSAVLECWNTRKVKPTLIIQNACQWQSPEPAEPPSKFPGYGDASPLADKTNAVVTHPREGRRWQAARIFDNQRHKWRE